MSNVDETPAGWDPEVFARIRAESEAEQAATPPEERERLAKFRWEHLDSLDSSGGYAPDSLRDKMTEVPGFDNELNPFPVTREPGDIGN
ncbi:hypothetical protein [Nocardia acidivorans]|uniref:hypothetical protein n=1 Tax=Nocardia acidivorans TaxID=404580 RepID=UPI000AE92E50|nr:hypothetical protein [Nocardia acidivorans]